VIDRCGTSRTPLRNGSYVEARNDETLLFPARHEPQPQGLWRQRPDIDCNVRMEIDCNNESDHNNEIGCNVTTEIDYNNENRL